MEPVEVSRLVMDGMASATSFSPETVALDILITRYVNAAAYVILLYDHLLSLDTEINLIWLAKTNSAKVLFLFIRYMVPCAITLYTVQLTGLSLVQLSDNLWVDSGSMISLFTFNI
ncbi:hypothetical protein B0H13DRAFT_2030969 [Mycena leptocephala]|nr:hypothetical protein B0H13DRAFT_2030969 [Mycena leptocephala]